MSENVLLPLKFNSFSMKSIKKILASILFFISFIAFAQPNAGGVKFKVTGKVIEKSTNLPLEYSTITLKSTSNPNSVFGGITNNKGEFSVDVNSGNYNIIIEFISFQANESILNRYFDFNKGRIW